MLSKNQVVKVRKAIEKTYVHQCTIIEKKEVTRPNHSTGFDEVITLQNQKCRISFKNIASTQENSNAAKVVQIVKLFIAPEIKISPGSKLVITHDGIESEYSRSGVAGSYPTHQEIILELFKDWA